MRNVNLPAPVLILGAILCVLAGFLVGTVAGPESPSRTIGVVESYDAGTRQLCLSGDAVSDQDGVDAEGRLCGDWQRAPGSTEPKPGDEFRFVSRTTAAPSEGDHGRVLIYGDVVD